MNKTVLEDHLHESVYAQPGDALGIRSRLAHAQNLGPFDERHAQDAFAGQLGQDLGEDHVVLVAEVLAKTPIVVRLDAEVELGEYRASEFFDGRFRLYWDQGGQLPQPTRHCAHDRKVEGAQLDQVGSPHLDRHHAAVGQARLVHLRDRSRGQGNRGKFGEDLAQRPVQILLDGAHHVGKGKRSHVVLQVHQGLRDVIGKQIGTGAHDLSDFDESGAQSAKEIEHAAAKPGLAAFAPREGDDQPQPACKPAQSLLDEQDKDGQSAQKEPRVGESGSHHRRRL